MIKFDKLQFSDDLRSLLLECEAEEELPSGITDVTITKIYLEYYKNRTATLTPSDKAVQVWPESGSGSLSHVGPLEIPVSVLEENKELVGTNQFKNGLFYVYVIYSYTEDDEVVPGNKAIGAVLDWNAVYQKGMAAVSKLVKECNRNACEPPLFFEQFVIVWHALSLAIDAKDFDMVDRLWGRFLSVTPGGLSSDSPCNCG